jgi:hypothetical protein
MKLVSAEGVRVLLDYDQNTGVFTWRTDRAPNAKLGAKTGRHDKYGYTKIKILGRVHLAHRLAWLHVHGEWPTGEIDHINGDRADNRITNLRLATRSQNGCNTRRSSRNTSGVKGVRWHKHARKWAAQIKANGRYRSLGYFDAIEDAAAAYRASALKHFGEFANTGNVNI